MSASSRLITIVSVFGIVNLLWQGIGLLQVALCFLQHIMGLVQLLVDGFLHVFLPLVGTGQPLHCIFEGYLGRGKAFLEVGTLLS